jgi:stage V sporulation protein R
MAPISGQLRELQAEIQGYADEYRLDYFTQVFEIVDYEQMCEIAAYGGFPVRYPHWRFGMEYDHMIKSHTYGLSKIYELVINTDPCYAYLLGQQPSSRSWSCPRVWAPRLFKTTGSRTPTGE